MQSNYSYYNYSRGFQPPTDLPRPAPGLFQEPNGLRYPDLHPDYNRPSAPPEESRLYPELENETLEPDFGDDCSICLDTLRTHPEGDHRAVTVLSKTECNHFFHEFCLNEHLEKGVNSDCPLCRHTIERSKITKVNPDRTQAVPPASPAAVHLNDDSSLMRVALQKTGAVGVFVLEGAASLTLTSVSWGLSAALNVLKSGFTSLTAPSIRGIQNMEDRIVKLFKDWDKMVKDFNSSLQSEKEKFSTVLALINSLPVSHHSQAKSALQRVERAKEVFEKSIIKLQKDLELVLKYEEGKISRG